jgi:hypothetical protein
VPFVDATGAIFWGVGAERRRTKGDGSTASVMPDAEMRAAAKELDVRMILIAKK